MLNLVLALSASYIARIRYEKAVKTIYRVMALSAPSIARIRYEEAVETIYRESREHKPD